VAVRQEILILFYRLFMLMKLEGRGDMLGQQYYEQKETGGIYAPCFFLLNVLCFFG
jgi:hypothetical protein